MSTTNALRNSLLPLGLIALAGFLCGGGGDGAGTVRVKDILPRTAWSGNR